MTDFQMMASHQTRVRPVSLDVCDLSRCLAVDLEHRVWNSWVNVLVPEVTMVSALCRLLVPIDLGLLYHRERAEAGPYHLFCLCILSRLRDPCLDCHPANLGLSHGSGRLYTRLCNHQSLLDNRNCSWRLEGPSEHQSSFSGLVVVHVEENLVRIRDRLAL